jgi:PAS domain S-box-containing protein
MPELAGFAATTREKRMTNSNGTRTDAAGSDVPSPLTDRHCRALVENSLDAIALVSGDGVLLYGSPAVTRILGYRLDEVKGRRTFDLVHPDDRPAKSAGAAHLLAAPGNHVTQVLRFRHRDGSWRWLEVQETNLLHEPGVGALVANFRDVTQRVVAEEALRESEERFRHLAEATDRVFWFTALDPVRVLYVNPAFERILGRRAEELYEQPRLWLDCIHPEDRGRVIAAIEDWWAGRAGRFDQEYRIIRPDGEVRWIQDSGAGGVVEHPAGRFVSGIAKDITERKQAEEERRRFERQMQEAQKLESLEVTVQGRAGGQVHAHQGCAWTCPPARPWTVTSSRSSRRRGRPPSYASRCWPTRARAASSCSPSTSTPSSATRRASCSRPPRTGERWPFG